MTQAKAALEELSADPRARERAELRRMSEMVYFTSINAARREGEAIGRAEGEAIGRAEGEAIGRLHAKLEALERFLAARFGGLSEEVSRRLHQADEPTLDRWLERAFTAERLDDVLEKSTT